MSDLVFVRVHAMPCVNRCWHCFCNGSPDGNFMKEEAVLSVLNSLVGLKEKTGLKVFPMYYDEPTLHPSFLKIMSYQLENDLIFDNWWFSTNGYGLARLSNEDWSSLAEKGFKGVRLTFHGIGEEHDRLVGRKGAFDDLEKTIRRAEEYGVDWLAGMMLSSDNVSNYEITKAFVEDIGTPCTTFGWMLPHTQGRAETLNNRVRIGQIAHLLKDKSSWKTEGELMREVLSSVDISARKALNQFCGIIYLDIDQDLNVSFGGGCDGDPFHFCRDQVLLGSIDENGIMACYEKYMNDPPEPMKILSEVSWGELAERYGDPDNDQVFHVSSLPGLKWAELYLKEYLPYKQHT